MNIRRLQETEWHSGILTGNKESADQLIRAYHDPLLDHILGGFGNYLRHDLSLANEAVWVAFQHYLNSPCTYQSHRGSLLYFLELHAVKKIQQLLELENRNWHFQQLHFILARYFDNEQDMRLAKQLLKNEINWCELARILNAGGLPIGELLKEINRNVDRIRKILGTVPVNFTAMGNKRKNEAKQFRKHWHQLAW